MNKIRVVHVILLSSVTVHTVHIRDINIHKSNSRLDPAIAIGVVSPSSFKKSVGMLELVGSLHIMWLYEISPSEKLPPLRNSSLEVPPGNFKFVHFCKKKIVHFFLFEY